MRRLMKMASAPRTPNERILASIWAQLLGREKISVNQNIFELGGDSILIIQAVARAAQHGLQLTPQQMFQYQTISELARVATLMKLPDRVKVDGKESAPLTPIQRWFFDMRLRPPNHFNQSVLLQTSHELDLTVLRKAVTDVFARHDALRFRFFQVGGVWQQQPTAIGEQGVLSFVNLTHLSDERQRDELEAAAGALQGSLDFQRGIVARAVYFRFGASQAGLLLIIIHHLVVDNLSLQILLEDLETSYRQIAHHLPLTLPAVTASYVEWAKSLTIIAESDTLKDEASFWLSELRDCDSALPLDLQGENTFDSVETVLSALSVEETDMLCQAVPRLFQVGMQEALLTALVESVARWVGRTKVLINIESHGQRTCLETLTLSER